MTKSKKIVRPALKYIVLQLQHTAIKKYLDIYIYIYIYM